MADFTPASWTQNAPGIAAVQDILKEVWVSDVLESQLYEDTILLDWIEEVTEYTDSDGLKASVPLRTGRTGGVGARGVGERLAHPGKQRNAKATYNYKNLYLTVAVNGPVVARMETNRQACVREIDNEVKNGISDFKKDTTRQLHGDGSAKLVFTGLPGNASSVTIPLSAANWEALNREGIWEGMLVDIGTTGSPTARTQGNEITAIDDTAAAPTITVANATAVTAGDFIFLAGNRTAGGSNEINGLGNIISDSAALGGIDPTVAGSGYWKSYVNANGGTLRNLSLNLMNTTNRRVRQKGDAVDVLLSDLAMQQKYYELLQSQVRFAGDAKLAAGSVEGPQFNNTKLIADPDCRPNRIYFLTKSALQMFSAGDIAWQNQTAGGDILQWRQEYDQFVGRAAKYCQVGTDRRRSLGLLTDINDA